MQRTSLTEYTPRRASAGAVVGVYFDLPGGEAQGEESCPRQTPGTERETPGESDSLPMGGRRALLSQGAGSLDESGHLSGGWKTVVSQRDVVELLQVPAEAVDQGDGRGSGREMIADRCVEIVEDRLDVERSPGPESLQHEP